jgi:predicted secreted protein
MAYDRVATATVPSFLRRQQAQSAEPALPERSQHVSSLTSKFAPYLADADAAIQEAADLRELLAARDNELRYKTDKMLEAADIIDEQEQRIAILTAENHGFRERMKIFAEAATAIIAEVTKTSADAPYVRKGSELVKDDQPVKLVRQLDEPPHVEVNGISSGDLLKTMPLIVTERASLFR